MTLTEASSTDFQRLGKAVDVPIPSELEKLLEATNGDIYFYEKRLLSTERIIDAISTNDSSRKWKKSLLPFAADESSYLVIDTDTDGVYEWDTDGNYSIKIIFPSIVCSRIILKRLVINLFYLKFPRWTGRPRKPVVCSLFGRLQK